VMQSTWIDGVIEQHCQASLSQADGFAVDRGSGWIPDDSRKSHRNIRAAVFDGKAVGLGTGHSRSVRSAVHCLSLVCGFLGFVRKVSRGP
jgi:hypothetical protein